MRRSTVLAAANAAALVPLTGCRGDDASTASGAFEPARAAVTAGGEPYAATVTATPADSRAVLLTGRGNLGAVFTGRSEVTSGDGSRQENVVTADHLYTRGRDRSGKRLKAPKSTDCSVAHREPGAAGARSIGLDQWIDARRRTRRAGQTVSCAEETTTTTDVLSDFGPVETFTEPGPLAV
ncbi:hypothetical protein ACFZCK_21310 [Kitasatospora purpeofusca]|uniref:hypothetical protein n=1 Tax=Kitasatospora purpeofusca TaxID=67352 RepID=UPI0036E46207